MLTKLVAASENECARAAGGVKVRAPFASASINLWQLLCQLHQSAMLAGLAALESAGHSILSKEAAFPLRLCFLSARHLSLSGCISQAD
jgi:hypothetical protein